MGNVVAYLSHDALAADLLRGQVAGQHRLVVAAAAALGDLVLSGHDYRLTLQRSTVGSRLSIDN